MCCVRPVADASAAMLAKKRPRVPLCISVKTLRGGENAIASGKPLSRWAVTTVNHGIDRAGALQYHPRVTRHQWLSHPAAYEAVFHADAHRLNPSHKPGRE